MTRQTIKDLTGLTPTEFGKKIASSISADEADLIAQSVAGKRIQLKTSQFGSRISVSWSNPSKRLRFRVYINNEYIETTEAQAIVDIPSGESEVYVVPVAYGEELNNEKSVPVLFSIDESIEVTLTESRVGQMLTVNNPNNQYSYYVIGRRHNTDGAIIPITAKDITASGYVIDDVCMGLDICVVAYDRNTFLPVFYSPVFGPILHSVDPVGSVVTTPEEFIAARDDSSVETIILAAGSTWSGDDISLESIDRSASPLCITTPQHNPALFKNQSLNVRLSAGLELSGLCFYNDRQFETSNDQKMLSGSPLSGITLRGVKFLGDAPTDEEKIDTTGYPGETPWFGTGMNFMPTPFGFPDCKKLKIFGLWAENVFQIGDIPTDTICRDVRFDGIYYDGLRTVVRDTSSDDDEYDVSSIIGQNAYSMYDEMDWANGTGNAPHTDLLQMFNSNSSKRIKNAVISDVVYTIGRTRAAADNVIGSQTLTGLILNNRPNGLTIRNAACAVGGSKTMYYNGDDISVVSVSALNLGVGGGGSNSISELSGEMLLSKTLVCGSNVGGPDPDGYIIENDVEYNLLSDNFSRISRATTPASAIDVLLSMRPIVDNGIGPVTEGGYLRQLLDVPPQPQATSVATPGGATIDCDVAENAHVYRLRYRQIGATQWSVASSSNGEFQLENLGSAVDIEYQARVVLTDGTPSFYSDIETIKTLELPPAPAPQFVIVGNGINDISDESSTTENSTRRHLISNDPMSGNAHVVMLINDVVSGPARVFAAPKTQWIDGSQTSIIDSDINELNSSFNSPGGSVIAGYVGAGVPPAPARGVEMRFESAKQLCASAAVVVEFTEPVSIENIVSSSTSDKTNSEKSVTLESVWPGSRVLALAYTRDSATVEFSAGVSEILSELDSIDPSNGKWILGEMESTTGGSIEVRANNCWALVAVAVPITQS